MFIQFSAEELISQGIITGKEEDELENKIKIFFSKLWDTPNLMFYKIWVCRDMIGKLSKIEFSIPFNFFERKNND